MQNSAVDVRNSALSAWLDEMRFKDQAGSVALRFVVDENGVTALETTDLGSGIKSRTKVLSRETSVFMAVTEAPPMSKGKK